MRYLFVCWIALVMTAAVASAGDVKVSVTLTTEPEGEPTKTFGTDTPKIFAMFKTEGIAGSNKVRGVLVAEDVGDAAPANTKVLEKTLTLDEDTDTGDFNFSKPTKGWPPGKYRIDVYVNDELATKAKFTIEGEAGEKEEKSSAESSSAVPGKEELKSMTSSSILSFGRAVKKKDFSGLYEEIAPIWKKQTTPEKLREAFNDFYNKDIDLPAAIKGKEPVFNRPPTVNSDGVLVIQGYYPTTPNRVVFQLKYLKDAGEWKLVGIDVNLKE